MERNRSKKVKSLGAAREITRLQNQMAETHMVSSKGNGPPSRNFVKTRVETRRFQQNAAVANQGFSLANGHDQFLVVTNILGNAVPYVDSWRIKAIDVWAVGGADGSVTNVILTPTGSDSSNMNNDPEQGFSISARSFTEPTHMRIKPAKYRPLGGWHFTSNVGVASTLFQMNITNNTGASNLRVTMDITFEVRENLIGLPLGYGVVTSTTTLGTLGSRGILSGFTPASINNLG